MLEHIERLKAWQALDLPAGIERQVHQIYYACTQWRTLSSMVRDWLCHAKQRVLGGRRRTGF
jgi:hypothetical protein